MTAARSRLQRSGGLCSACGESITVHEALRGGHCANEACRRAAVQKALRLQLEHDAGVSARVEEIRTAAAAATGLDRTLIAPVVVPANDRALMRLPQRRKSEFHRHLIRATTASDAEEAEPRVMSEPATRVKETACATCRGQCCLPGASRYAFLDGATLARYRAQHPGLRPRDVVAAYMHRIPRMTVEGSCVFHGEFGCTLPRRMRSPVCNGYECEPLRDAQHAADDPRMRGVLIVAASDGAVARWSVHGRVGDGPAAGTA